MSKITPKNLSYDNTLPPFLQRLQANNNSDGPNQFQPSRPKKPRNADDEAEDEPVYFDEQSGETLTKREWEEKQDGGEEVDDGESQAGKGGLGAGKKETKGEMAGKEKIAAIGVSKKRKAGKIVGAQDRNGGEKENGDVAEIKTVEKGEGKKAESGKIAKKGKKVKLSFGDDE
jgi:hypothetical protein